MIYFKNGFFIFSFFIGSFVFGQGNNNILEINKVFEKQNKDWNEGNIPAFMEGYWNSDSLRFIGKQGIQYGWKKTLENYKKGYPDKQTMGTLKFEIEKLEILSNDSAFMIGKWFLKRQEKGDVGGAFTLLWKKKKGKWLIVVDHTS